MSSEKYDLLRPIGSGHFGEVFLARHRTLTSREYALKLIPTGAPSADVLAEAKVITQLPDHTNVLNVHDAGQWDSDHMFVMSEYCPDGSLADFALRYPLHPSQICDFISGACRGLEHIHTHGLLHLDLRPANILLACDHTPMLADFGLSRWTHSAGVDMWYGPHAAPEYVESEEATEASDIFSMAMTLMHLLTNGESCRGYPEELYLVEASANGEWPRLDDLPVNVPKRLRNVIAKATDYDPTRRHKDIGEFKRELDRATPGTSMLLRADGSLVSPNERCQLRVVRSRDGWDAEVLLDGRRIRDLCRTYESEAAAAKVVTKHVNLLSRVAEVEITRGRLT